MRLPRDISGLELIKALEPLGYKVSRQVGSHVRLTRETPPVHHLTVPLQGALRIGTLANILADIAAHLGITRENLIAQLFGKR